jgi:hypothetical protein
MWALALQHVRCLAMLAGQARGCRTTLAAFDPPSFFCFPLFVVHVAVTICSLACHQGMHLGASLAAQIAVMEHSFVSTPALFLAEWRLIARTCTLGQGLAVPAATREGERVRAVRELRAACESVLRCGALRCACLFYLFVYRRHCWSCCR